MESRLFVYGTLRRGEAAGHLLAGAEFIGKARIHGKVIQRGGYPGLVGGEDWVDGELFDVPQPLFEALDNYEGPGYMRKLSAVQFGDQTVEAWVYWLLPN
jgi:gamma-glutamylcyclotransferase (GGCT)/AIG2-like uncharacterized protein YtfP